MDILIKLLLAFMLLIMSFSVFSTEDKASLRLEVYANHIPPYVIIENHDISGFSRIVLEQLLKETQYKARYHKINWARSYKNISSEPHTVMLALSRLPIREESFHWIGKIGQLTPSIWCKKERYQDFDIKDDIDIAKYSFSEVRGFRFHKYLESLTNFPKENLYLTVNKNNAIGMLSKGRVDLMASDELVFQWRLKTLNLEYADFARVYEFSNTTNDLYISMSKSTPLAVVNKMKKAFVTLKSSGRLAQLYNNWLIDNKITKQ